MSTKKDVPKNAQCSETYEKNNLQILRYGRFCAQNSLKIDQNVTVKYKIIEFCSDFAHD